MTARGLARLCCGALASLLACEQQEEEPSSRLPDGVIAAAGSQLVSEALLQRVMAVQGLGRESAFEALLGDAIYAEEALSRAEGSLGGVERLVLARRMLEVLRDDAWRAGPPTDEEVRAITEERFWEFDRPELRRTTHAVVVVDDPARDAPARALARRISEAVTGTKSGASFADAARGVPAEALTVRIENLAPVALDGRAVDPREPPLPGQGAARYDEEFARGVFAIPELYGQSPVVRTAFGYHVILLTEIFPERRVPLEERRRLFAEEVARRRAQVSLRGLLETLRASSEIAVERAANELMGKVRVAP